MSPLEAEVRTIIRLLVRGDYEQAAAVTPGSRIGAEGLRGAILEYGRTLAEPGPGWWAFVDVVPIRHTPGMVHVAAPLWTIEEGRSDLTLELWSREDLPGLMHSEILDLHVL